MYEKILLIGEKQEDFDLLKRTLAPGQFIINPFLDQTQEEIFQENYAVILADHDIVREKAYLIEDFQKSHSRSCIIFYGAQSDPEEISQILQKGVYAFIPRALLCERIYSTILQGLEHRKVFIDVMDTIDDLRDANARYVKENQALTKKNIEQDFIIRLSQKVAYDFNRERILPGIVKIGLREIFDYFVFGVFYRIGSNWNLEVDLKGKSCRKKETAALKSKILSRLLPLWKEKISNEEVKLHLIASEDKIVAPVSWFFSELKIFPLRLGEKRLGNLFVVPIKGDRFLKQRMEFLTNFSNILALPLHNAQEHHLTKGLSVTDNLTGIYNATGLKDFIKKEFYRAKRHKKSFSFVIIDLNNFKAINEFSGRQAGDFILRELAGQVQGFIRRSDILARYGKNQFALLLPETGGTQTEKLMKRMLAEFEGHVFKWRSEEIKVGLSYGIDDFTELHQEENEVNLIQRADAQLKKNCDYQHLCN